MEDDLLDSSHHHIQEQKEQYSAVEKGSLPMNNKVISEYLDVTSAKD